MKQVRRASPFETVLKLMRHQKLALRDAGAARSLLATYDAILGHLSALSQEEVEKLLVSRTHEDLFKRDAHPFEPTDLTLDQVEAILWDETVSRRQLEAIAVGRFAVPRGSMRSFSSMRELREKLSTLVRNERAHQTISEVAGRSRI